jgi:His/Glu/Gln/Arg/opine family amino acid ABC transporter permease subunit
MAMSFDLDVIAQYLPLLLQAALVTLELSVMAGLLGTAIGLACALTGLLPNAGLGRVARRAVAGYVWLMRGLPPLVVVLFSYYGMPGLGIALEPYPAAVGALAFSVGAFWAEIFRAGIEAVPTGQWDAGRALGLRTGAMLRTVVLPQAFRVVLPPYVNGLVALVKETSLVSVITVRELTLVSQRAYSASFRPFEILTMTALLYLAMTSILMAAQLALERRFRAR